ncbi:MAG: NADH-quinone oxidoreductase subunit C [Candidatus Omnitrophota bacterium]|nr:NADH-quinone oxidoreductase subunit C [Candidatus Omnitrophota bacterium]
MADNKIMEEREIKIKEDLLSRFPNLNDKIRVQRDRRIYAEIDYANFVEVFEYAMQKLNFTFLCAITGLDEGERISFIYHITTQSGIILNLKTSVPKEKPVLKTIIGYFPGAEIYERELEDLLGVKVEGLPEGKRYPLPDDWPKDQYPLRKDWKVKCTKL